jgi:hypothetical protein
MAKCDEGYRCDVCGQDVEDITQSDLYLRFVLGEVDPETLHATSERHIRCNPTLAQFIVTDDFAPIQVEGPFAKRELDEEWVAEEESRVTRGFLRLREIFTSTRELPITEYPLPGVAEKWTTETEGAIERFDRFNRP